uniref:Uncharacterized protein n=1 Tax=Salix viminalis TaxID=40686 RepID=A0A6N2MM60_SALVM
MSRTHRNVKWYGHLRTSCRLRWLEELVRWALEAQGNLGTSGFGSSGNSGFGKTGNSGFGSSGNSGFGKTGNSGFGKTGNSVVEVQP